MSSMKRLNRRARTACGDLTDTMRQSTGIRLTAALLVIGFVNAPFARTAPAEVNFESNKNPWKDFFSGAKSVFTAPLRWEKSDWTKASLTIGVTMGLYAYDQDVQDWTQEKRNNDTDKIASFAKPFGDGRYILPAMGAFYLYGYLFEDERARRTVFLGLESFLVSGIFIQAIKLSGHRHRPGSGDSHDTWEGPGFFASDLSFPSGHSSSAFSIATILANEYDETAFIPPLAYGMAALTALSRVNDNAHWASDVFLGSAIGYFTAKAVTSLYDGGENGNLVILPMTDGKYAVLFAAYRF